jgi:hypothetical protein
MKKRIVLGLLVLVAITGFLGAQEAKFPAEKQAATPGGESKIALVRTVSL